MFVPLCLMFVVSLVCPMLYNAWCHKRYSQRQKLNGASLFTRRRHSQYHQRKLKAKTSERSSIYICLLHCVDKLNSSSTKNVLQTIHCYNR